jgi:hypothetical protein
MNKSKALALLMAKGVLGASLALGLATSQADTAKAQPLEDEPGWSCVDDGNRVCGPDNDEGKPAGCYDEGGVLVALWPCAGPLSSDDFHRRYGYGPFGPAR